MKHLILSAAHDCKDDLTRGIIGTVASGGGLAISLSALEQWLRILCGCGSLVVFLLTAISVSLSIRRKWKRMARDDEETN